MDNSNDYITWDSIDPQQQSTPVEQPQPEMPWDENSSQQPEQPISNEFNSFKEETLDRQYSMLGRFPKLSIDTDVYTLGFNPTAIINELSNLTPKVTSEKGKFLVDFSKGENLQNLIITLKQIASSNYDAQLEDCFVYKLNNGDSLNNITSSKPKTSFIYYLQAEYNSSQVILDLSSIGGPSQPQSNPASGILNIFPGWVPFSLSNNTNSKELIAIGGSFN